MSGQMPNFKYDQKSGLHVNLDPVMLQGLMQKLQQGGKPGQGPQRMPMQQPPGMMGPPGPGLSPQGPR